MEGKREFFKDHIRRHRAVYILGAMLIALIVTFAVIHVAAFIIMSGEEIENDMLVDVDVASGLASARLGTLGNLSTKAAAELSKLNGVQGTGSPEMVSVLDTFSGKDGFDECFFLSKNKTLLMNNGQSISWTIKGASLTWNYWTVNRSYRLMTGLGIGSSQFFVVAPVYQEDSCIGFFMGGYSVTEEFKKKVMDYTELETPLFIVDTSGNVLMQKGVTDDGELDALSNLYRYFDEENENRDYTSTLKGEIAINSNGYFETTRNEKEYAVAFDHIEDAGGWSVVSVVPKRSFLSLLVKQRTREISLILFDIIIALAVVVLMFGHTIRKEKDLRKALCDDTLTNALTKEYFRSRAKEILDEDNIPYSIVTVDILGFRYINELFGRERGDEIIRMLAELLGENLGSRELIARNHADCFEMMIADGATFKARLPEVSARLRSFGHNIDVTYPIMVRSGIAQSSKKDRDISGLLDKANAARKATAPQNDIYVLSYDEVLRNDIKKREEIEASMESAMEHGEFRVFLQPKMDVIAGKLSGAEALVRWIKRDNTMVFPDEFMPVFESNGFVERLDFYMLEEVCKLQRKLGEEGCRRVPISVNQSQILLRDPQYVDNVMSVLKKYEVPRELIELELTETTFFGDKERMIEIMNRLRSQDCRIDIDDFGSGYSSLNMIKDIPFDILKIDREFFSDSNSGTGRIILEKIVEMASAMGVDCICEGVETKEQEQLLREIGCRYAQGYFYSKPIPAGEFVSRFIKNEQA